MKVILVPFCFYPDAVGGTEIYVESLGRELQKNGWEVVIAAPSKGNPVYSRKGLKVLRFASGNGISDLSELYDEGDPVAANNFSRILDDEKPDIVHLHAFTQACSLRLVRETKLRNIPVIFSYHTPTTSCRRGTLMRWGRRPCDGMLRLFTCSQCTLHGRGMDRASAFLVGSLPPLVGKLLKMSNLSGDIWTALRMTELIQLSHRTLREFLKEVDHIITLAQWVKDLLIRNGVSEEKISLSRHAVPQALPNTQKPVSSSYPTHDFLRIVYMGRLDPSKGVHILIQAIQAMPKQKVALDVYGIIQDGNNRAYEKMNKNLACDDSRIHFHQSVPVDEVVPLLRSFDVLAVPSQGLETGPLVILQAFAAGIPVVGSRLGGIAELVQDGVNGLLVEPKSVKDWVKILKNLCEDRSLLIRIRNKIRPPRQMDLLIKEMQDVYSRVLRERHGRNLNVSI